MINIPVDAVGVPPIEKRTDVLLTEKISRLASARVELIAPVESLAIE